MPDVKLGDIVRILPEFYRQHFPIDLAVVEELVPQHVLRIFKVGFPMCDKKLWLTREDVEIVEPEL